MKRSVVIAALLCALAVAAPAHAAFQQRAELTASDAATNDLFGAFVSVSGDTAVVSAPGRTDGAGADASHGAVYVFEKPASGWDHATQTAKLTIPSGGTVGPVAISGDTIVVGIPDQTLFNVVRAGAAVVFVKPADGWKGAKVNALLLSLRLEAGDELGTAVAISGDTVVAGSPERKVGGITRRGAAYVFEKPADGWQELVSDSAELTAADGGADDALGRAIAISGDTVVLGSEAHDFPDSQNQGAAYVYAKPAAGWADSTQSAELVATDGRPGDRLGTSVAAAGETVAAGAPGHANRGAAYVLTKPSSGWQNSGKLGQTAELAASDGAAGDKLGLAVAASGERIVAGAPQRTVDANAAHGAAYVFAKQGQSWSDATEVDELTSLDGGAGDQLGFGVAIDGNAVLASTPFRNDQGSASVFSAPPAIAIDSPAGGATFTQGQVVPASFACTAAEGTTIAGCAAPVPIGARIDTGSLGAHSFEVRATSSDGITTKRAAAYTVVPGPTGPTGPHDDPPPAHLSISGLSQSAAVWRSGSGLARAIAAKQRRPPVGTTFSFRLNQPARVALRFTRGGRSATLRLTGRPGANQVRFQGRISRKRKLRRGRYRLRVTATNARAESSSTRSVRFRIVR
jgi:hypothetical protein